MAESKTEIEKLLAEIEKKFSVDWGFSLGFKKGHPGHFIAQGKGIVIPPGEWQGFKEKRLKRSSKHTEC